MLGVARRPSSPGLTLPPFAGHVGYGVRRAGRAQANLPAPA